MTQAPPKPKVAQTLGLAVPPPSAKQAERPQGKSPPAGVVGAVGAAGLAVGGSLALGQELAREPEAEVLPAPAEGSTERVEVASAEVAADDVRPILAPAASSIEPAPGTGASGSSATDDEEPVRSSRHAVVHREPMHSSHDAVGGHLDDPGKLDDLAPDDGGDTSVPEKPPLEVASDLVEPQPEPTDPGDSTEPSEEELVTHSEPVTPEIEETTESIAERTLEDETVRVEEAHELPPDDFESPVPVTQDLLDPALADGDSPALPASPDALMHHLAGVLTQPDSEPPTSVLETDSPTDPLESPKPGNDPDLG